MVLWIRIACFSFRVRVFYPLWRKLSSLLLLTLTVLVSVLNPTWHCCHLVWPVPRSLATTYGISFDFSSCRYLDVSVPCVSPLYTMDSCIDNRAFTPVGFPHSDICGSKVICTSPQLFAACHVLLRLLVPRHSPYALISLTSFPFICSISLRQSPQLRRSLINISIPPSLRHFLAAYYN